MRENLAKLIMIDIEKMIATVVDEIGIDGETAIRFFNQMIVGDDLSFSIIDHKYINYSLFYLVNVSWFLPLTYIANYIILAGDYGFNLQLTLPYVNYVLFI